MQVLVNPLKTRKEIDMKMKRVVIALVTSLGLVWATNPCLAADGVPDPGVIGDGTDVPPDASNQGTRDPSQAVANVEKTVQRSFAFTKAEHVANGTALRDRTSGTIQLRGVPASRPVLAAYLYWNLSDASSSGPATAPALFNGNAVIGTKTADNIDPCWGRTGNYTY
jgi:hypothetical protein